MGLEGGVFWQWGGPRWPGGQEAADGVLFVGEEGGDLAARGFFEEAEEVRPAIFLGQIGSVIEQQYRSLRPSLQISVSKGDADSTREDEIGRTAHGAHTLFDRLRFVTIPACAHPPNSCLPCLSLRPFLDNDEWS